jgi:hypothetical protein
VLGIDEGGNAAEFLGGGDDVEGEGSFAGGFGAEYFEHAAARHAEAAEGNIEAQRAGGDAIDVSASFAVEFHDSAFAELLFDLLDSAGEGGVAGGVVNDGSLGFGLSGGRGFFGVAVFLVGLFGPLGLLGALSAVALLVLSHGNLLSAGNSSSG